MHRFSILAAAAECPNDLAWLYGDTAISFAALAYEVQQVIVLLQRAHGPLPTARQATPAACVGVVASNELPTFQLIYALIELGVPFALIHPRLPQAERQALQARLPITHLFEPGWKKGLTLNPVVPVPVHPAPDEAPLCIVFTAGTTGTPKALVLSHRAFHNAVAASAHNFGWTPEDRWLLNLPVAHVGGLSILLRCLAARRPVVLPEPITSTVGSDIERIAHSIEKHQVTLISLVPTLLQRLIDLPHFTLPKSVRAILLGGDGASPALLQQARERGFPIFTSYGMTEMASQVTTQRYALGPGVDPGNGPAVLGNQVRIGPSGRVEVKGASLFSGHWQPPHLTLPLNAAGWFETHDHGSLDDQGCLHVLGRDSDLIVSGGENVYPAHVERVIAAHASVAQCCVFGLPDPIWGQVVCALLVGPSQVSPALIAHLEQHLMPHQRPRKVALVGALPQTPAGKVDRKAARENNRAALLSLGYS